VSLGWGQPSLLLESRKGRKRGDLVIAQVNVVVEVQGGAKVFDDGDLES
jgi:hypothetical protein